MLIINNMLIVKMTERRFSGLQSHFKVFPVFQGIFNSINVKLNFLQTK